MEKETMKKNKNISETIILRKAAERIIKKKSSKTYPKLSEPDILKLLHELDVHQVELEMQNNELMNARDEVRTAGDKLTSLYDFANTGYFTVARDGKIHKLNLRGATMLGKERLKIINKNFRNFVTIDTLSKFNDFILRVFESNSKESCHVRLITKGNLSIFVLLEGLVSGDEEECQLTVIDETMQKRIEELLKFKSRELEQFDEFMVAKDQQMIELKKEINHLLNELGKKEKFEL
jgi:transcriptional regulator with PAS, ATPase and Fis domain